MGDPDSLEPVEVIAPEKPSPEGELARPGRPARIEVPEAIKDLIQERQRVATGLANPRGMLADDQGVLVALAGTGDPANPKTGGLVRLVDRDGDGDYLDPGEVKPLLQRQPSRNILEIVRRDEVFGVAAVAKGGE
jgi:hypothetical protein